MFNLFKKRSPESKIDFIQSFGKLEFEEGDIIVLMTPNRLSKISHEDLREFIESVFKDLPFKFKIMVLEGGMDVGIMRKKISDDMQDKPLKGQ